jgi:epoxyqueuosine reductase
LEKQSLTDDLKREAKRLGFQRVGVCPAVTPPGIHRFHEWLEAGYAGEMSYLPDRSAAYEHPQHVLDGSRSLVVMAMNYRTETPQPVSPGQGMVSRYAWGTTDYHDLIQVRLKQLRQWVLDRAPTALVRGVVDTAPLLEREFAQLAGLGWVGKNTLLLNRQIGSWFFLAVLLTDLELEFDEPTATDHCGTCTACLDACPTDAFPQPYVLDATRCVSYLTIELRESIPLPLRSGVGDWLFGCDVCQDVCPWNHRAPTSNESAFQPADESNPVSLAKLFDLTDESFRQRFRKTPLWRSKRRGILRNAAIVLGNQQFVAATSALQRGIRDVEPMVRAASAWALGQIGGSAARQTLAGCLQTETDSEVIDEITAARRLIDENTTDD